MKGILIEAETAKGNEYKLEVTGKTQATVLIKFSRKFGNYVSKLDKTIKETNDQVIKKKATFQGSWSFAVIKQFTPVLDKNNIEWWLDP